MPLVNLGKICLCFEVAAVDQWLQQKVTTFKMWSYVGHDPHLSVLTLGLKRGLVLNRNIDNGLLQHVVFLKTFFVFNNSK